MLGRSETPFLSGSLACSMMACRTSVIKQKVFIGRGRKLAVVVSCTIGRSSVALFLYSSRTHLSLYLGLDASCLLLLPGLRIHSHHENARTHTFERSIRSRLSQVVMGLSRERRCHGITSTLITDSHAITLPSLPLWVYARRRNSTGLTLARSTFGFDGSLDDGSNPINPQHPYKSRNVRKESLSQLYTTIRTALPFLDTPSSLWV